MSTLLTLGRGLLLGFMLSGAASSIEAQDFGAFKPFEVEEFSPPNGVNYVADPTGSAPTEMVFTFDLPSGYCSTKPYGDGVTNDCGENSTRAQMVERNKKGHPSEAWYGFSIYFPADFPYGTKQTRGHYEFAYWHNDRCPHLTFQNFAGNDDTLSLGTNTALGGYDCRPGPQLKVAEFADLVGKWSRFEIFVKWASDETGEARVFIDGRYVARFRGATLTAGLENRNYFKFGQYLCCTEDVTKTIGATLMFAAVKQAATRDGLFVEEDTEKLKTLQARLNELGCDVGVVDGQIGPRTKAMAMTCRAFPEGKLPPALSAGTVAAFVELYADPATAGLPAGTKPFDPEEQPVALVSYPTETVVDTSALVATTYEVNASETQSQRRGKDTKVVSDISARIKEHPALKQLDFVVAGNYSFPTENFINLQLILADVVESKEMIAACRNSIVTYPDGSAHAAINFRRTGPDLVATNAECLINNLPAKQSAAVSFLVQNFADIAVGMVKSGAADLVQHDGLKAFVYRIARGEVSITSD